MGIAEYDHGYERLAHVPDAVARVGEALERAGFRTVLPRLRDGGPHAEVNAQLNGLSTDGVDKLLLFWTGHAQLLPDGGFLLVRDTPGPRQGILDGSTAISAADLARKLRHWGVRRAVVVLDTCYAGAQAAEFAETLIRAYRGESGRTGRRQGIDVIASCGPFEPAVEGSFAEVFADLLRYGPAVPHPDWGAECAQVGAGDVFDALCEAMGEDGPDLGFLSHQNAGRFFANPLWTPGMPGADAGTRAHWLSLIDEELRAHFVRAARGVGHTGQATEVDDPGWYFSGRTDLLTRIVAWLDEPGQGVFAVTGSPGSGKSAVLGRIATLAVPHLRELAARAGVLVDAEPGTVPDVGTVDIAVTVKSRSLQDCRSAVAAGLGLPEPAGGWLRTADLVQAVSGLARPVRIVVDALDEARPDAVTALATDLLRPLAQVPGVKVLVGTRPDRPGRAPDTAPGSLLWHLAPQELAVLDEDPLSARDIEAYVRRRLAEAPGSPYAAEPEAAARLARRVAGASGQSFLLAGIAARRLVQLPQPDDLPDEELRALIGGGAAAAFDADLARLGDTETAVRDLLTALAWAEGAGMPRDTVWPAVATAVARNRVVYTAADVDRLLARVGHYVTESGEDGQAVYRLYHRTFSDHLRQRSAPDAAAVRDVQQRLVAALLHPIGDLHTGSGADDAESAWSFRWAEANPYLHRHLSAHAAAAGALYGLAADPEFLIHAEPRRLTELLGRPPAGAALLRLYLRTVHHFTDRTPEERAAILLTAAAQNAPELLERLTFTVRPTWTPLWSEPRVTAAFHRTLLGHEARVDALAGGLTDEGKPVLATGDGDGRLRLWDTRTGLPLALLVGHESSLQALAMANSLLASGGYDKEVRIWDVRDGRCLATLTGHTQYVSGLAWARDEAGSLVLAVGSFDGGLALWDIGADGIPCGEPRKVEADRAGVTAVTSLQLPDGSWVFVSTGRLCDLRLWHPDGTAHSVLEGHDKSVRALATVPWPDGRTLLASGGDDHRLLVWDPQLSTPVLEFDMGGQILALAALLGPHGRPLLATSLRHDLGPGRDAIHLHELDGSTYATLPGHARHFEALATAPLGDGTRVLVSGGVDDTARLWDIPEAPPPYAPHEPAHRAQLACYAPEDGDPLLAVTESQGGIHWRDLRTGATVAHTAPPHHGRIRTLKNLRSDSQVTVVSTGSDPENDTDIVMSSPKALVRLNTGKAVDRKLLTFTETGGTPAFVSARENYASGLPYGELWVTDLARSTTVHRTVPGSTDITSLAEGTLPWGGGVWASGDHSGTVRHYAEAPDRAERPSARFTCPTMFWGVSMLEYLHLPFGRQLLAATGSSRVQIWNPRTGALHCELRGHDDHVTELIVARPGPGGPVLVTTSADCTLRVWDPSDGRPLLCVPVDGPVQRLAAHGRLLAFGGPRGLGVLDLARIPEYGHPADRLPLSRLYESGAQALRQGDAGTARRLLHEVAEAGVPEAATILGQLAARTGDLTASRDLMGRAAEGGDPDAALFLAQFALQADDVEGARRWCEQAAAEGSNYARIRLGTDLAGPGGDPEQAEAHLRAAAAEGLADAYSPLAELARRKGDAEAAKKWQSDAAHAGSALDLYAEAVAGWDPYGSNHLMIRAACAGSVAAARRVAEHYEKIGDKRADWWRRFLEEDD
ncbi:hypothetical protein GCM10010329_44760 [Streptomyces spiroverticillatus]|uniref:Peptidase C14 caspase domain-containing protein n=1 Tax=Streptomyces finlayi TaxID=67296 RepID=A0A918WZZ6_9ACTN|nr:hypothetical protein GCM10010329_44760 [Streptomyces spiroverticillatus]GHC98956.1 hypothetical protein GCM10010334_41940 [Streptomyces finlayi]